MKWKGDRPFHYPTINFVDQLHAPNQYQYDKGNPESHWSLTTRSTLVPLQIGRN